MALVLAASAQKMEEECLKLSKFLCQLKTWMKDWIMIMNSKFIKERLAQIFIATISVMEMPLWETERLVQTTEEVVLNKQSKDSIQISTQMTLWGFKISEIQVLPTQTFCFKTVTIILRNVLKPTFFKRRSKMEALLERMTVYSKLRGDPILKKKTSLELWPPTLNINLSKRLKLLCLITLSKQRQLLLP